MPRWMRIVISGAAMAAVTIALLALWQARQAVTPGEYGRVPEFSLTERSGTTIGRADLEDQTWIADFIFTRCGSTCPLMTARMAELQETFASEQRVRLVTFTVDPEHDTPAVLTNFADRYAADPERWLFLSGDKRELYTLIRDGFRLGVEEAGDLEAASIEDADTEPFIHSTRLVLVDERGEIRGYYDAMEEAAMTRLTDDVARLIDR